LKENRKKRLDQAVVDAELAPDLSKARAMIMAGEILVDEKPETKSGTLVKAEARISLKDTSVKYVSRGGNKLAGALDEFQIECHGKKCLDVGASTGGFSDCLLQRGAEHVFTIDVGKGQLDPKIRNHPHVTWRESFHVRDLTPNLLPCRIDLAVVDVSFISLLKVLPFVVPCLTANGNLLALIKPQFEVEPQFAPGGVVKDEAIRRKAIETIAQSVRREFKFANVKTADSVLKGAKGNQEAFLFVTFVGYHVEL
jgi:23S rRNA (cytidine1920-2'-O)/16S rRNA (cytidine1409-2'-O)-methyltransferase